MEWTPLFLVVPVSYTQNVTKAYLNAFEVPIKVGA